MTGSGPDAGEASRATGIERVAPTHRAAGIYGLIVTASVLATGGPSLPVVPLAIAVFVTLVVYWLAEEYAELLEHARAGHLPTWSHAGSVLRAKWPMVTASYLPLLIMVVARLLGSTTSTAALLALIATVLLLMLTAWRAGRAAGLTGVAQAGMTLVAAVLGVVMILLKVGLGHWH